MFYRVPVQLNLSTHGRDNVAKRLKRGERELALLLALERGMQQFLRNYTRPRQPHSKIRAALEHIISERTLLQMALAGDEGARNARRMPDANADAVGE